MANDTEAPYGMPEPSTVSWREGVDRSTAMVVMAFFASAVIWLLIGSGLALVASIKMHTPGFLADWAWLTFGRVRPSARVVTSRGVSMTLRRRRVDEKPRIRAVHDRPFNVES